MIEIFQRMLERLTAAGCNTAVELRIFAAVACHDGPIPITALARALDAPISTVSRVAWTLCELDLLEQNAKKHDRRVRLLSLTARGRSLIKG